MEEGAGSAYAVGNAAPMPPLQQQQQPEGDDLVAKTIHIVGIDPGVMEGVFAKFLAECGVVTNAKICGDPRGRTLYGFIEFSTVDGAQRLMEMTGTTIGAAQITASRARSAIRSSMTGQAKVFNIDGAGPLIQSPTYNSVRDDMWITTGVRRSDAWGKDTAPHQKPNASSYGNQDMLGLAGLLAQPTAQFQLQAQQAMQQAVGLTAEQQAMHYEIQVKKAYERMGYSLPGAGNDEEQDRRRRRRGNSDEKDKERRRRRERSGGRDRDYERRRRRRRESSD